MPPEPASVACRAAVRATLADLAHGDLVLVACSGGPDSLALAAATAWIAPRLRLLAGAIVVDHGLQEVSAAVAQRAAHQCRQLGLDPVEVSPVTVAEDSRQGPEAAARHARYAALAAAATRLGAAAVLIGHTRDDQAEQVLLGLVRGSGVRSLAGMPRARPPFRRPLLDLPRETTAASCAELGLEPWTDPHNSDPAYLRVRVRAALRDLTADLGPGIRDGLVRTADLARADADLLDDQATRVHHDLGALPWSVDRLAALPPAIRGRVWRRAVIAAGAPAGAVSARHTDACDALVTRWHGQGPLNLPGGVVVCRRATEVGITGPTTVD